MSHCVRDEEGGWRVCDCGCGWQYREDDSVCVYDDLAQEAREKSGRLERKLKESELEVARAERDADNRVQFVESIFDKRVRFVERVSNEAEKYYSKQAELFVSRLQRALNEAEKKVVEAAGLGTSLSKSKFRLRQANDRVRKLSRDSAKAEADKTAYQLRAEYFEREYNAEKERAEAFRKRSEYFETAYESLGEQQREESEQIEVDFEQRSVDLGDQSQCENEQIEVDFGQRDVDLGDESQGLQQREVDPQFDVTFEDESQGSEQPDISQVTDGSEVLCPDFQVLRNFWKNK